LTLDLTTESFPGERIQIESGLWQRWKLESCTFHYTPTAAANQPGALIGAIFTDPTDEVLLGADNIRVMTSTIGMSNHSVWEKGQYHFSGKQKALWTDANSAYAEPRLVSAGKFQLAAYSSLDAAVELGAIWVTYRIKFWQPYVHQDNQGYMHYIGKTSATGVGEFFDFLNSGNMVASVDTDFYASIIQDSSAHNVLDVTNIPLGQYLFVFARTATGAAVVLNVVVNGLSYLWSKNWLSSTTQACWMGVLYRTKASGPAYIRIYGDSSNLTCSTSMGTNEFLMFKMKEYAPGLPTAPKVPATKEAVERNYEFLLDLERRLQKNGVLKIDRRYEDDDKNTDEESGPNTGGTITPDEPGSGTHTPRRRIIRK